MPHAPRPRPGGLCRTLALTRAENRGSVRPLGGPLLGGPRHRGDGLSLHVGIIGGGVAGLVAAWHLARAGRRVTIFERAPRLGGLAGSFVIEPGCAIEKYYHFLCRGDRGYLDQIDRLGLRSQLRWVETDM